MRTRTIGIVGALLVAGALLLAIAGTAFAQQTGPFGGWGCGVNGANGYRGGPGMMGGWGWSGSTAPGQQVTSLDEAKSAVERYLADGRAGKLVVKEVMEFQYNFYAIVGEPGAERNAMELLVDKGTGNVFPEYGPNMMWNTEYGHMGGRGMMGGWWNQAPSGDAELGPQEATSIAQEWLDSYMPGATTEHPDAFPGYYTLHVESDGQVTGMLSVNASSGQVWYHSWHGEFIGEIETS